MNKAARCPIDFRLAFHDGLSDSYELSQVLIATADFDGTLQLLTSGWERALGYSRRELARKTLGALMWSDRRGTADVVAQILDAESAGPVELRMRCRNGRGKTFRLHRLYDKRMHMMHLVAEEAPQQRAAAERGIERRAAARAA